jgi:hypothetical protein
MHARLAVSTTFPTLVWTRLPLEMDTEQLSIPFRHPLPERFLFGMTLWALRENLAQPALHG